jgi:thiaminase/transcriptional activator TenA
MTAAELFGANLDLATACRDNRFVQGLATGTLDRASFAFYVGQDAVFLRSFARAYALCLAKAPGDEVMAAFKTLLDGVFAELELHAGYAARWGVPLDVEPAPATTAYTDFLLRVAALEPPGHACAAMVPCMRLYAWLGRELAPVVADDSPYREWVETYADPEFEQLAGTLEGLLDQLGGDSAALAGHYRTAMRLELAFFEAATAS